MALRIAASGDVGGAMSYFTPARFPQEKQEAAVREAYIELRLRRLVAMAAARAVPCGHPGTRKPGRGRQDPAVHLRWIRQLH